MFIFLIISTAIAGILSMLYENTRYSKRKLSIQLSSLLFILYFIAMGFRNLNIGVDTISYYIIYNRVARYDLLDIIKGTNESIEVGYLVLMKICNLIIDSYFFFQVVVAGLFCFVSYKIISFSKMPIMACIVFLGTGELLIAFNITRQMLAAAIFCYGFIEMTKGHYKKTIFLYIICLLLHTTAIFAVICSVFWFLRKNKLLLYISPILALGLTAISATLLMIFSNLYGDVYNNYLDNHKTIQTAGLVMVLWIIEFLISCYIIWNKKFNSTEKIMAIMPLFYVAFNIIGLKFNYAERMGIYFLPFIPLTICYFIDHLSPKLLKSGFAIGSAMCFLYYFYISTLTPQYSHYDFFF